MAGTGLRDDGSQEQNALLVSELAAKRLGWSDALGRRAHVSLGPTDGPVVGVFRDVYLESLHRELKPMVIRRLATPPQVIVVRALPGRLAEVQRGLADVWSRFAPDQPLEATPLARQIDALYASEHRAVRLTIVFGLVAVALAGLGVLSLAAFTAERRTKEIGIRKVFGATAGQLVRLLVGDFLALVGVAALLGIPLGWYAMSRWLEDFAYRTQITWWPVVASLAIALAIAASTASVQSARAALANPTRSLGNE